MTYDKRYVVTEGLTKKEIKKRFKFIQFAEVYGRIYFVVGIFGCTLLSLGFAFVFEYAWEQSETHVTAGSIFTGFGFCSLFLIVIYPFCCYKYKENKNDFLDTSSMYGNKGIDE